MFPTLFRKEMLESWRTHRLLVLAVVLLAFGLLSPAAARFAPEIVKLAAGDQPGVEALVAMIPAPTAVDSVDQYLKNLTQMGILVMVLLAMGLVAREKESGTVTLVLARPVSRTGFLLAKFLAFGLSLALALALAAAACYLYTGLLFGVWLDTAAFLAINGLMLLYLLVCTALTFLGSALSRSSLAAAGIGLGGWILLSLLGGIGAWREYAPGRLASAAAEIGRGAAFGSWPAVGVSLAVVACCLILAAVFFSRQEV